MTDPATCCGVYREQAHSPGRIGDDAAIMESVATALAERGYAVELVAAEALVDRPSANIFAMCEGGEVLERLAALERTGAVVVNSPAAIRNTYRHRMAELFARHRIPSPLSLVVATDSTQPRPADCAWVKRYDFHATQSDDVMYAASDSGWTEALRRFAGRGIPFVVAQAHAPGDLIKFYGVRQAGAAVEACWFQWFYHRDKGMLGYPLDAGRLRDTAFRAAAALGVEVFGGDAIITSDGEALIIDLNAWPSYALYRERAAQAIADHLAERFRRRPRLAASSGS